MEDTNETKPSRHNVADAHMSSQQLEENTQVQARKHTCSSVDLEMSLTEGEFQALTFMSTYAAQRINTLGIDKPQY